MFKHINWRNKSPFFTPHESYENFLVLLMLLETSKITIYRGNYIQKSTLNTSNSELFMKIITKSFSQPIVYY